MLDRRTRTPDSSPHFRTYTIGTASDLRDYARTHAFDHPIIGDPNVPQEGTFRTGNRRIDYLYVPADPTTASAEFVVKHSLTGAPHTDRKVVVAPRIAAETHLTDYHLFAHAIERSGSRATHVYLQATDAKGVYAKVGTLGTRAALHLGPNTLADVLTVQGAIIAQGNSIVHIGTLKKGAQINAFAGARLTIRHLNQGSYVHLFGGVDLFLPNGCESVAAITILNGNDSNPVIYMPEDKVPPGFIAEQHPHVVLLHGLISPKKGSSDDDLFTQKGRAADGTSVSVDLRRIVGKKGVAFELA